jgi:hypothetical protein
VHPALALEDTPHGLQVHYNGRRLYGPHPRDAAIRRAQSLTSQPNTLVIWPSPLVWHGLDEALGRLGPSGAIIAVECDPVLHELARRQMPTRHRERLALELGSSTDVVSRIRQWGEHRFRRVVELTTSASARFHRDRYRAVVSAVEREIRVFWQNRLTLSAMGRLWLRNIIRNIPRLLSSRPLPVVRGTAIVCGAGPSLEAALPFITRHRDRLTIVAVDTAVPILDSQRCVPDVVIALEGQLANVYDFLPILRRDYRLLADLSSSPAVLELHDTWSSTVTAFAPLSLLDRLAALPGVGTRLQPLGSVGVAATRLALQLGASPLLLTGLDFAVLPGKTHSRGAPAYLHGFSRGSRTSPPRDAALGARLITADDDGGRFGSHSADVHTTLVLQGYAQELRRVVARRDDVYVVEPIGLNIGARPLSNDEASAMLRGHDSLVAGPTAPGTTPSADALAGFVRNELRLLTELEPSSIGDDLPRALDYLACELSDRIESMGTRVRLGSLDAGSRARVRVARDYYVDRWSATLNLLTD